MGSWYVVIRQARQVRDIVQYRQADR